MRFDSASHWAGVIDVLGTFENCSVSICACFDSSGTDAMICSAVRVPAR